MEETLSFHYAIAALRGGQKCSPIFTLYLPAIQGEMEGVATDREKTKGKYLSSVNNPRIEIAPLKERDRYRQSR